MAAGLNGNLTLTNVNGTAGSLAAQLLIVLRQIDEFQTFLLATDLTQSPILMASADQNTIKSAYTDLEKLYQIFIGAQTQATTYDFRTFAKLIWGTNP